MKLRKSITVLLVITMLFSLTACKTDNKDASSKNKGNDTKETENDAGFYVSAKEGGSITDQFTILAGWTSESPDNTIVQQTMIEQLGIDYKVEYMQSNDYLTTLNLKLGSGSDLPDIMIFPYDKTVESALITADRVLKLNDLYTSDKLNHIPNIDSRIKDYIKTSAGDMWWIPGYYAAEYDQPWGGWTVDAWWVRTDLLEKAGMSREDLTTIEGIEKTMRAFAEQKDSNGNSVIPLSFAQGENHQERIILSTFGVDTAAGTNGMPAVMDINGEQVFIYDNPNYKEAYKWMNQMYREGLIDMEAATISTERFREKIESGQLGMFTTDLWISGLNETWKSYDSGEDSVTFYYEPFANPKIEGVEKAYTSYVNPNPGYMVFINKDTEKLNAVLNFLDWVNDPNPLRGHEMNEGPVGTNWNFVDKKEGTWDFTPEYKVERDSGDSTRVSACTHQLYQFASYSDQWYAWWNQSIEDNKAGAGLLNEWCKYITGEIVNHRPIKAADSVKIDVDGIISENLASLNNVVDEFTAKMIMADTDDKFEQVYTDFLKQIELIAHWSEMKEEWNSLYQVQKTQ